MNLYYMMYGLFFKWNFLDMKVINVHCGKIWKIIETYKEENKKSRFSPFRALSVNIWYVTVLSFLCPPIWVLVFVQSCAFVLESLCVSGGWWVLNLYFCFSWKYEKVTIKACFIYWVFSLAIYLNCDCW